MSYMSSSDKCIFLYNYILYKIFTIDFQNFKSLGVK